MLHVVNNLSYMKLSSDLTIYEKNSLLMQPYIDIQIMKYILSSVENHF